MLPKKVHLTLALWCYYQPSWVVFLPSPSWTFWSPWCQKPFESTGSRLNGLGRLWVHILVGESHDRPFCPPSHYLLRDSRMFWEILLTQGTRRHIHQWHCQILFHSHKMKRKFHQIIFTTYTLNQGFTYKYMRSFYRLIRKYKESNGKIGKITTGKFTVKT